VADDRTAFADLVEAGSQRAERRNSIMINSLRLRSAFADRQVRTVFVATMVLLAAVVLGSHRPYIGWCCPVRVSQLLRWHAIPSWGSLLHRHSQCLIPFELGTGREVSLKSLSFADTGHVCAVVSHHAARP